MSGQEITIGRSPQCDICLGSNCVYASGIHATLYMDGDKLIYRDVSRNGTVINNYSVKQNIYPLKYGDHILIAGKYQLRWDAITRFFPQILNPAQQNYAQQNYQASPNQGTVNVASEYNAYGDDTQPDLGWNWGAFMLYPIWGFWNGCWWAILIAIFFGWLGIIPNILFGAMGSKWAWNEKTWRSAQDFNDMQEAWRPWGIAFFVFNIIIVVFLMICYSAFFMALLSSL